ncbi:hypothetical protein [Streptomyces cacaoi]|uniref:hypothetical protein n=1 Tax=Streptomyces cacaoi TaxID=1898 RepID=UPI001302B5FC|nr:hypothetical protein [Streptomyces cacaoi]NNG84151.1 hypothetical protein [Streptomyces cacaoi]
MSSISAVACCAASSRAACLMRIDSTPAATAELDGALQRLGNVLVIEGGDVPGSSN